jgi:uncharacterized glyoxalase superfamily protein PhnB
MAVTSCYPVLMTHDVQTAAAFYRRHFGFEVSFEADWYVSLVRDRWELAVLDASHPTIPISARSASGVLINLEVDDVDAEYDRLVTRGPLDALLPLRSEDFGQRHFIVAGPDDVLIDVITPIQPTGEYSAQFADAQHDDLAVGAIPEVRHRAGHVGADRARVLPAGAPGRPDQPYAGA